MLRNHRTREYIPSYADYAASFRPGDRIQMSVVFTNDPSWESCPKCGGVELPDGSPEFHWQVDDLGVLFIPSNERVFFFC